MAVSFFMSSRWGELHLRLVPSGSSRILVTQKHFGSSSKMLNRDSTWRVRKGNATHNFDRLVVTY